MVSSMILFMFIILSSSFSQYTYATTETLLTIDIKKASLYKKEDISNIFKNFNKYYRNSLKEFIEINKNNLDSDHIPYLIDILKFYNWNEPTGYADEYDPSYNISDSLTINIYSIGKKGKKTVEDLLYSKVDLDQLFGAKIICVVSKKYNDIDKKDMVTTNTLNRSLDIIYSYFIYNIDTSLRLGDFSYFGYLNYFAKKGIGNNNIPTLLKLVQNGNELDYILPLILLTGFHYKSPEVYSAINNRLIRFNKDYVKYKNSGLAIPTGIVSVSLSYLYENYDGLNYVIIELMKMLQLYEGKLSIDDLNKCKSLIKQYDYEHGNINHN
jgi:hypothetical protein